MKLHLVTTNDTGFNYLNYLSVMSALLHNDTVLWYEDKQNNEWWYLIEKMAQKSPNLELRELDPFSGFTINQEEGDQTGRTDIIYLAPFDRDSSIDDAFIDHNVFEQNSEGVFERKDITLVRVFKPESEDSFDFITPEWVSANDTLLSALIKRVYLERVWNPYGRK